MTEFSVRTHPNSARAVCETPAPVHTAVSLSSSLRTVRRYGLFNCSTRFVAGTFTPYLCVYNEKIHLDDANIHSTENDNSSVSCRMVPPQQGGLAKHLCCPGLRTMRNCLQNRSPEPAAFPAYTFPGWDVVPTVEPTEAGNHARAPQESFNFVVSLSFAFRMHAGDSRHKCHPPLVHIARDRAN